MEDTHPTWLRSREAALRDYFGLSPDTALRDTSLVEPEVSPSAAAYLSAFNLEWHVIPNASILPFDERYCSRLYRSAPATFVEPHHNGPSLRALLAAGHRHHVGRMVAVETTMKPAYLPGHHQRYGSRHGFDDTADPLTAYMDQAGFQEATRYNHNYLALRTLVQRVSDDWRKRMILPVGYRVTICPPVVFNLIGTVFHPEWSETESLEIGFYTDGHHNAQCYAVGANQPGDFSFVHPIETASDWKMFGFRLALVPATC